MLTVSALQEGQKYIGVDPAGRGKDRSVISLWEGDTLIDMEVYHTEDLERLAEPDELDPLNPGAIVGRLTIAMMEREAIGARYVGGDVIGDCQGALPARNSCTLYPLLSIWVSQPCPSPITSPPTYLAEPDELDPLNPGLLSGV